ncbi:hypothetical protein ACQKCU_25260 [Heyndrickxia sporothermodurans]
MLHTTFKFLVDYLAYIGFGFSLLVFFMFATGDFIKKIMQKGNNQ